MARRILPSRLELKRCEGSFREAPLANVIFTWLLYTSPVQIMPSCDQTGTPSGFATFFHFRSSTTSGSASSINVRIRESTAPRQSSPSAWRGPLLFVSLDCPSLVFVIPDKGTVGMARRRPTHLGRLRRAETPRESPSWHPDRIVTPEESRGRHRSCAGHVSRPAASGLVGRCPIVGSRQHRRRDTKPPPVHRTGRRTAIPA